MSFIDIIFEKLGEPNLIKAKPEESFAEVVKRYSLRIGEEISEMIFLFNSRELKINSTKSLSELNIKNLSKIEVITTNNIKNYDGDFYLKFIYNSSPILVPCYNNYPFEKVIERLKYMACLESIEVKHLRFFYKNKELIVEPGKTAENYNLDKNNEILCVIDYENENRKIIKLVERLKEANEEINILKNKLQQADKVIDQLKHNYNNNNQMDNNRNEIEELKKEHNNTNNKNPYVRFEDIKILKFISDNGIINNYPIKCLISETFAEVEERLYQAFPVFRETNNTFISNRNDIKRFKKISENNIKEGCPIQLISPA